MAYNKINALLEKYWAGTSSLEEEQLLKDYFNSGNVAPEFEEVAPLFQFFKSEQNNQLTANFEDRLLQQLVEKEAPENDATLGLMNQSQPTAKQFFLRRFLTSKVASIAAMLLLAIGVTFFYLQPQIQQQKTTAWEDTYENPEQAYKETMIALKLISDKLNRGKKATANGLMKVKESTNLIKK